MEDHKQSSHVASDAEFDVTALADRQMMRSLPRTLQEQVFAEGPDPQFVVLTWGRERVRIIRWLACRESTALSPSAIVIKMTIPARYFVRCNVHVLLNTERFISVWDFVKFSIDISKTLNEIRILKIWFERLSAAAGCWNNAGNDYIDAEL